MVYKYTIYDVKGQEQDTESLNEDVFNDELINHSLIHEAIVKKLANERHAIADVKNRSQVKVSWKKLYRQKWTWRARVGDAGSPIRKWGGKAFGPKKNRNFSKKMPKKMRRKALLGSLLLKVKDEQVFGLNEYSYDEIKTKKALEVLDNIDLSSETVLVVIEDTDQTIKKSFRNIEGVTIKLVNYLHPYDMLSSKNVLFVWNSFDKFNEIFVD